MSLCARRARHQSGRQSMGMLGTGTGVGAGSVCDAVDRKHSTLGRGSSIVSALHVLEACGPMRPGGKTAREGELAEATLIGLGHGPRT